MTVSVVIFDAFGTLVEIVIRLSPYRSLLAWSRDNGRPPQASDAALVTSQDPGLAGVSAALGMAPPVKAMVAWEDQL